MTVTLAFKAFAKVIPCLTPFFATSDPSVLKRILVYIPGLPCSLNISLTNLRKLQTIAHRSDGYLIPIKIRPHVGAAMAACLAGEARFNIGEIIRPPIPADRERVAAPIIRAIDQEAAHAHVAHFGEGDFFGGGGTLLVISPIEAKVKAVRACGYRSLPLAAFRGPADFA
jgi:hypothetical protein